MRREEQEHDMLEQLLRESLASEAAPSDDFTARLMEKVNRTPQEKRVITFPRKKVLATVAACAVIAAAIPLALSGGFGASMNDAVSADCAVPTEGTMQDTNGEVADQESAADAELYTSAKQTPESETPESTGGASNSITDDGQRAAHVLTLTGDAAQNAADTLADMGIDPVEITGTTRTYTLTVEQTSALFTLLGDVDGEVTLVLELEDAG